MFGKAMWYLGVVATLVAVDSWSRRNRIQVQWRPAGDVDWYRVRRPDM